MLQSNPTIVAEFEAVADAIITNFGVNVRAIMEVLTGVYEPYGLLPFQMPANMKTVEEQFEDFRMTWYAISIQRAMSMILDSD